MSKSKQAPVISETRKRLYYVGLGITALGLLLFMSNFILPFMDPMNSPGFVGGFAARGLIGFILIFIGQMLMKVGKNGVAASGLILDPERAREDLAPWSKMNGGIINDTLSEVEVLETLTSSLGHQTETVGNVKEIIKIKCQKCSALNDEDASFCKNCGEKL